MSFSCDGLFKTGFCICLCWDSAIIVFLAQMIKKDSIQFETDQDQNLAAFLVCLVFGCCSCRCSLHGAEKD